MLDTELTLMPEIALRLRQRVPWAEPDFRGARACMKSVHVPHGAISARTGTPAPNTHHLLTRSAGGIIYG